MSTEEVESPVSGADEEAQVDDSPAAVEDTPPDAAEEGADETAAEEAPKKKKRTPKPKKPIEAPKNTASGYPRTADMIIYAVESIGVPRIGASVQGIKNFILKTYPKVNKDRLKHLMKSTLPTCVDGGAIMRPEGQEDFKVMSGRYKKVPAAKSTNPTCEEMVVAAVGAMDERKGATVTAIKAYIIENYAHVRPEMLRHQIRMGLTKASAKGSVAPHTPGKTDKVSLAARWHIKGAAKKEIMAKKAEEAAAAKQAEKAAAAKKKTAAAKRAAVPKRKTPPKARKAPTKAKKVAAKKPAPKKRSRR